MRRLGLILALIGASVLFLGAAPGSASAANCTGGFALGPTGSYVWYDSGVLFQRSGLWNCSGITEVQFWRNYDNFNGYWSGLLDATAGGAHVVPSPQFADVYTFIAGSKTEFYLNWGPYPWCGNGVTHSVRPYFTFRIKSSTYPFNYGPMHEVSWPSGNIPIWC